MRIRRTFTAILVLGALLWTAPALSDDARAAAAQLFRAGEAAERAANYREAALRYAEADELLPNDDVLLAAIETAEKADLATLALRLSEKGSARSSPKLQNAAAQILRTMRGRSARFRVECPQPCSATLDGVPLVLDTSSWVEPGTHAVVFQRESGSAHQTRQIALVAGQELVISLVEKEPAFAPPLAPVPAARSTTTTPPEAVTNTSRDANTAAGKPLPPWLFAVGAGVTGALVATTIVFAVDTAAKHDDFVAGGCASQASVGTCANLADAGRSAQTRTNVFLGVSAGAAALTAALGLFLVDWRSSEERRHGRTARNVALVPLLGGVAIYAEVP